MSSQSNRFGRATHRAARIRTSSDDWILTHTYTTHLNNNRSLTTMSGAGAPPDHNILKPSTLRAWCVKHLRA